MRKVIVLSPDYDGCFDSVLSPRWFETRAPLQNPHLQSIRLTFMKQLIFDISENHTEQREMLQYFDKSFLKIQEDLSDKSPFSAQYELFCEFCKKQSDVEMYVGSARQTEDQDRVGNRENDNGFCHLTYKDFCEKTQWAFQECFYQIPDSHEKADMLNQQLTDIRKRHPTAEVEFYFYDDRQEVITDLLRYLQLPDGGMRVHIRRYDWYNGVIEMSPTIIHYTAPPVAKLLSVSGITGSKKKVKKHPVDQKPMTHQVKENSLGA